MNTAAIVLMAIMAVVCALLVYGSRWLEIYYYRTHPPDEDDACREEKFDDDEHSGTG